MSEGTVSEAYVEEAEDKPHTLIGMLCMMPLFYLFYKVVSKMIRISWCATAKKAIVM